VRNILVLRLIVAFIFSTFAILFSELIPPVENINQFLMKAFVTSIAAGVGFLIFPDLARYTKAISLTFFNFIAHRVSSEVMNQIIKLPRGPHLPFGQSGGQIGSMAIIRPLVLDTSAIIDGRVLDIAKTGFISGLVLVPKFVLTELQQVADSADDLKRQRGRRGFEVIEELKKVKAVRVEVWDKDHSGKTVDDKLLNLAKATHGKIITTDYNLNRVASVSNISVLNVNDLSNAVKTNALPGEKMDLKIMHIGKDPSQGVGYLEDGTMIVVSGTADQIGKTIKIEVTKSLQIPAGRMIFGKKT
jgi:uncharacterized protein YacL